MLVADFDYDLPDNLIAQEPARERDASRLLVLHRRSGAIEHKGFRNLPGYLRAGDVLVLNDSKVFPARLRGRNVKTGGRFEMLLLEETARNEWWVMLRPGRRAGTGTRIAIEGADQNQTGITATVAGSNSEGHKLLRFDGLSNLLDVIDLFGETPLPPYIIRREGAHAAADRERYQTVYARLSGSVAAPTAGLHFTEALLEEIRSRGVSIHTVTLHVGLGTFAPVKCERIEQHPMHEERYEVTEETARAVNEAKGQGRRIIAVGTTSVRVLEAAANAGNGELNAGRGSTKMFIYPPFNFRMVDGLVTNFHLPRSTLLMLVSAFAAPGETRGRELVLAAYGEAVRESYRFFSYGDAMLLVD